MDWRMNPNSLFAILMRKPWWVSALIAAGFIAFARVALPPQWFIVGAAGALPFLVIAAVAGWRAFDTPGEAKVAATIERLRRMSWPELAAAVSDAWKRDGHEVLALDEPGADFEVVKAGRRGLVAARRWKVARLGVEPLRELQAARDRREAGMCWYVVTGEISEPARRFATQNRIILVEGVELVRRLGGRARG
jgi:restriction system protein